MQSKQCRSERLRDESSWCPYWVCVVVYVASPIENWQQIVVVVVVAGRRARSGRPN